MTQTLWTVLAIAVVFAVGYLLVMLYFWYRSREVDSHIDFSKIKPLKDDED